MARATIRSMIVLFWGRLTSRQERLRELINVLDSRHWMPIVLCGADGNRTRGGQGRKSSPGRQPSAPRSDCLREPAGQTASSPKRGVARCQVVALEASHLVHLPS